MPAIGHFVELRDSGIVFLQLVLSSEDRQWDRMVFLARDEQEGTTLGFVCIDLIFRPRVEVGGSGLEDGRAGSGDRVLVVKLLGFVLIHRIGKAIPELPESQ